MACRGAGDVTARPVLDGIRVLDYGRFQFGRDFGGTFSAPSRNVFLVKMSYWINQ